MVPSAGEDLLSQETRCRELATPAEILIDFGGEHFRRPWVECDFAEHGTSISVVEVDPDERNSKNLPEPFGGSDQFVAADRRGE